MKFQYLLITLIILDLVACSKVPITGRRQINMLPETSLIGMSLTNYNDFLSKNKVNQTSKDALLVKTVGNKIANAVSTYLKNNKQNKRIKNYKWEFNLVENSLVNAWCMPGGKVVVYTGILPVTQDETGLAVVMGHEAAHAIARHGNERMSQGLLTAMGGVALDVALSQKPDETRKLFLSAYGVGSTVGALLPFSRLHESEADKMGMVFMAMAGYNPEKAINFWERMAANKPGYVPEFLSTHPSDETRIKKIREFLPTAMKYYHK